MHSVKQWLSTAMFKNLDMPKMVIIFIANCLIDRMKALINKHFMKMKSDLTLVLIWFITAAEDE